MTGTSPYLIVAARRYQCAPGLTPSRCTWGFPGTCGKPEAEWVVVRRDPDDGGKLRDYVCDRCKRTMFVMYDAGVKEPT